MVFSGMIECAAALGKMASGLSGVRTLIIDGSAGLPETLPVLPTRRLTHSSGLMVGPITYRFVPIPMPPPQAQGGVRFSP